MNRNQTTCLASGDTSPLSLASKSFRSNGHTALFLRPFGDLERGGFSRDAPSSRLNPSTHRSVAEDDRFLREVARRTREENKHGRFRGADREEPSFSVISSRSFVAMTSKRESKGERKSRKQKGRRKFPWSLAVHISSGSACVGCSLARLLRGRDKAASRDVERRGEASQQPAKEEKSLKRSSDRDSIY